ncbi:hypothetical protein [Longilinea arvoryzae]|nr:hypothetical protein [Longilinea arvoryzae]
MVVSRPNRFGKVRPERAGGLVGMACAWSMEGAGYEHSTGVFGLKMPYDC